MSAARRRKRLGKSLKPREGDPAKLSQRLIQVAQPYLNGGEELDEYRKELMLASAAWNMSLLPPESREDYLLKSLNPELEEEHRQLIVQHLGELVRRKETLFPGDRRMIANVDVLDEGDSVRVLVASLIC